MNTTHEQKISKKELLAKGWTYLNDNFHKFTEDNRIKIALTLCVKDMPTQLEGDLKGDTKVVVMVDNNGNQSTQGRLPTSVSIIPE